jgi:hypothetical protein
MEFLLHVFNNNIEKNYINLIKTLDYYMLQTTKVEDSIYYFVYYNNIFIVTKTNKYDDTTLLKNIIRQNNLNLNFLLIKLSSYSGFCDGIINETLNEKSKHFFEHIETERKKYSRILKINNALEIKNKRKYNIIENPIFNKS